MTLAIALVATFAAACAQGVVGFGFAVLSVPVLALVDTRLVPMPQLLITLPMTVMLFARERGAIDRRGLTWLLAGRVPGAALGALLLAVSTPRTLNLWIAFAVLGAVALLASGRSLKRTHATEFVVGVVSGVMAFVAAIGGPPLALLYRDAKGPTLRATLSAVFALGSLITIIARLLAGQLTWLDVEIALWLLPALVLGVWVSRFLVAHVEGDTLRRAVLGLAAFAGVGVLAKALFAE
ncbi:MAG: sulfite exporter TauE/SafE family protein [Polyangiales bacterium]